MQTVGMCGSQLKEGCRLCGGCWKNGRRSSDGCVAGITF